MTLKPLPVSRVELASLLLMAITLILIMPFHLLAPLLAGLLVFEVINNLARFIETRVSSRFGRPLAVAVLVIVVLGALGGIFTGAFNLILHEVNDPSDRLTQLLNVIDKARSQLPSVITNHLPSSSADLYQMAQHWAREHVGQLRLWGRETLHLLVAILMGMVLGAVVAVIPSPDKSTMKPLARALQTRVERLADAFHRIVFAQIKISLVNTILSGIVLLVIMPLAGEHIPLAKTLVLLTFVFGLLPVIGNLISNALICVVGLSVSIWIGLILLVYLMLIHKLEYLLNARIVGGRISARAWELLLAMLVMESIFGLGGLIAAPIFYAYLKIELRNYELI
ncbi:hypothetical protein LMG33818_002217 [Halomonadaceae bacterium LMG 33818]|uniref:AI-2E family transporter n=1 Tax=Cernens ardua TaxID=3402176 RepID=UPI003EDBBA8C